MIVYTTNCVTVESLLIDFEVRPYEKFGRQFFDCKSDGISGFGKTPVAHRPVSPATARGKKLGRGGVVKAANAFYLWHCGYPILLPRRYIATGRLYILLCSLGRQSVEPVVMASGCLRPVRDCMPVEI